MITKLCQHILSNHLVITFALIMCLCSCTVAANDKGLRALTTLIELIKIEHPRKESDSLSISVNEGEINGQKVYYFLSGYELFSKNGNIIQLSLLGMNEVLFHESHPEWKNVSPTRLLAAFPILPEMEGELLKILKNTTDLNVKVALTVALRGSVFISSETIRYLSKQVFSSNEDVQMATIFALLPRITDSRFARLSNFDLKPVISALYRLSIEAIPIESILMIEALLNRDPYLFYFGTIGNESKSLLMRTARVKMYGRFEKARRSFRQ